MSTTDSTIPREERIRRRAEELYRLRGSKFGSALDDWLQAKKEVIADSLMYHEPTSMMGSRVCADSWPPTNPAPKYVRAPARTLKPALAEDALAEDALPAGTCRGCGFVAEHGTPADCIEFLRDMLAEKRGVELVRARKHRQQRDTTTSPLDRELGSAGGLIPIPQP